MESGVYEKVQEYFTLLGRAELITCSAQQSSFSKVRDQAQQVCMNTHKKYLVQVFVFIIDIGKWYHADGSGK